MIPSYNCSQYLEQTIRSVLAQDPGSDRMQIEVVDDCSTDADIQHLVDTVGQGRVSLYRQSENKGSLRNFETCLNRSTGRWIHLLHGDDLVYPGFYKEIERLFREFPEVGAAFTGHLNINDKGTELYRERPLLAKPGIMPNWLSQIAVCQLLQPPAMVVKRSVYEQLGGFFAVHYAEDWEMWVRIAAHYPVAHSPALLAGYRLHGTNITSRYFKSGQSIADIAKVIDIIQQYLPEEERKVTKIRSLRHASRYFATVTDRVYHELNHPQMALAMAKSAMAMHRNRKTMYFVVKNYLKILLHYKFNQIQVSQDQSSK
jgi:glycosyltransferase involved in cell wall biosynthesis